MKHSALALTILLAASTAQANTLDDFKKSLESFVCQDAGVSDLFLLGEIAGEVRILSPEGMAESFNVVKTSTGYKMFSDSQSVFISETDEGWLLHYSDKEGPYSTNCTKLENIAEIIATIVSGFADGNMSREIARQSTIITQQNALVIRLKTEIKESALNLNLAGTRAKLADALSEIATSSLDRAAIEVRLLKALGEMELAQAAARKKLSEEQAISTEAQRRTELLNQQIAALRNQLGGLQALLDDSRQHNAATQIQLQTLGSDLNIALARAVTEERKRRLLEEAERKRAEAERLRP